MEEIQDAAKNEIHKFGKISKVDVTSFHFDVR